MLIRILYTYESKAGLRENKNQYARLRQARGVSELTSTTVHKRRIASVGTIRCKGVGAMTLSYGPDAIGGSESPLVLDGSHLLRQVDM